MSSAARAAAIELLLVEGNDHNLALAKLGLRVFPTASPGQSYRKMHALVHPDKNQNSPRATQAAQVLGKLWGELNGGSQSPDFWAGVVRRQAMSSLEMKLKVILENEEQAAPKAPPRPKAPPPTTAGLDQFMRARKQAPPAATPTEAPVPTASDQQAWGVEGMKNIKWV
ncbi:unnamed protein product [Symbiodinium sp. CCMP2456]|nr:unnamed protein product [Symbiodinium sp. CCMP2456]